MTGGWSQILRSPLALAASAWLPAASWRCFMSDGLCSGVWSTAEPRKWDRRLYVSYFRALAGLIRLTWTFLPWPLLVIKADSSVDPDMLIDLPLNLNTPWRCRPAGTRFIINTRSFSFDFYTTSRSVHRLIHLQTHQTACLVQDRENWMTGH
jgi:hypothetical protein